MALPDLSVIIVSYHVRELLAACLRSLTMDDRPWTIANPSSLSSSSSTLAPALRSGASAGVVNRPSSVEIIVVDNASADGSADMVAREFPDIHLIQNTENIGYARANNQGIAVSNGRYIVLLNSDTLVPPGTLEALVAFMEAHPQAGACSPGLLRPDGAPQPYAFGCDPTPGYLLRRGLTRFLLRRPLHDWGVAEPFQVDWVSGACLLARRSTIDQVGGLDERFFMYFEDNDWCRRMRLAGWQVWYVPEVAITHIGGAGARQNPAARTAYYHSLTHFYSKHYGVFARAVLLPALAFYRVAAKFGR